MLGSICPVALRVDVLVVGEQPSHDARGVRSQSREVVGCERCGRADDVPPESECRSVRQSKTTCVHDIIEVDPAVQQLIDLQVGVVVHGSELVASSGSGKNREVRRITHGRPLSR